MEGDKACPLCLDPSDAEGERRALLLPCLHRMCARCTQDYFALAGPAQCKHQVEANVDCDEIFTRETVTELARQPAHTASAVCSSHPTKDVYAVCEPCGVLVCPDCEEAMHEGHDLLSLEEAVIVQASKLLEKVPALDVAITELVKLSAAIAAREVAIKSEIDGAFALAHRRAAPTVARARGAHHRARGTPQ